MHSLAKTSEETVDMVVNLVDGDVSVAILCPAELLETVGTRVQSTKTNLERFREQRSQSRLAKQFPIRG